MLPWENVFWNSINSAIPFLLIAIFWNGMSLKSAMVEFTHSSDMSPVRAVIRPSRTRSLYSAVVTTFSARVRRTSPSAIVWDNECGESSNSAPFAPIRCNRFILALEWFVCEGCDLSSHLIVTYWLEDKIVSFDQTLLVFN